MRSQSLSSAEGSINLFEEADKAAIALPIYLPQFDIWKRSLISQEWRSRYARTIPQINAMLRISVEEAANTLKTLLGQVAQGEEIILVEQDREVARLVPPQSKDQWLANTKTFRASLNVQGESLSETVIRERQGERF